MRRNKLKTNVLFSKFIFLIALFLFAILFFRVFQLSLVNKIDGMDIKTFSSNLKTVELNIPSDRGTIYDSNGNTLAQNVSSYTVIAYLSDTREEDYVQNKEKTAKLLAPLINMEEDQILTLLYKDLYQVELGPGGRNLSQSVKDEIAALELPGIDFIKSTKRYYPNGDYASYLLGYAKVQENGEILGEMGIEKYFNEELKGIDGKSTFIADRYGIKIVGTNEEYDPAQDGNDVYLTIDTNIQMFTEQALKHLDEKSEPEWGVIMVADAKTGAILGASSTPSFDPNLRNVINYLNPMATVAYEPGSTMKIFTYMAAMEKGTYVGTDTYKSGKIVIEEDTVKDWNKRGWGEITFDYGFAQSSNVAVSTIMQEGILTREDLKNYFLKLGFNKPTGVQLPNENTGKIDFKYPIETANASFGQGITTTAIQNVQALTSISNKGVMLKPYFVDKVVSAEGEIVFQNSKTEIGRVASEETVEKITELMKSVINGTSTTSTGYRYYAGQYNIMGKTGTAQIFDTSTGEYLTGYNDYVKSFSGIFPSEDPEIIIYASIKKGSNVSRNLPEAIVELTKSIGKYLNINQDESTQIDNVKYEMPSYINQYTETVKKDLKEHNIIPTIIGDGTKVINQYPASKTDITYLDKVFLVTNSTKYKMPDLTGFSKKDILLFANLVGLKVNFEGTGFAVEQNIKPGVDLIDQNLVIKLASVIE